LLSRTNPPVNEFEYASSVSRHSPRTASVCRMDSLSASAGSLSAGGGTPRFLAFRLRPGSCAFTYFFGLTDSKVVSVNRLGSGGISVFPAGNPLNFSM
jgi:hypothetical protein